MVEGFFSTVRKGTILKYSLLLSPLSTDSDSFPFFVWLVQFPRDALQHYVDAIYAKYIDKLLYQQWNWNWHFILLLLLRHFFL